MSFSCRTGWAGSERCDRTSTSARRRSSRCCSTGSSKRRLMKESREDSPPFNLMKEHLKIRMFNLKLQLKAESWRQIN